jgi:predicted nucleic acid-binding protein
VNAYIDTSTLLRVILNEPGVPALWSRITRPISSELIRVESLRTVDRARLRLRLEDVEVARLRKELLESIEPFTLVQLDGRVLARAAEPFPTVLGTLDAIHLASALLAREQVADLRFATSDHVLETAARAVGFDVLA